MLEVKDAPLWSRIVPELGMPASPAGRVKHPAEMREANAGSVAGEGKWRRGESGGRVRHGVTPLAQWMHSHSMRLWIGTANEVKIIGPVVIVHDVALHQPASSAILARETRQLGL